MLAMNQMELKSLVGSSIAITIPRVGKKPLHVTLIGVEAGGIWIESQGMTDALLGAAKVNASAKTPVFFLPYNEIAVILHLVDKMSLNERALGGR
jgi:hypothetical protein